MTLASLANGLFYLTTTAATVGLSYLFIDNYQQETAEAELGTAIAFLNQPQGDVRVRPQGNPSWLSGQLKAPLAEGDWVYTAANSGALISYFDRAELEIGSSSLVVIDRDEAGDAIDVLRGLVYARLGSQRTSLEIKVGGVRTTIKSPDAQVQIDANSDKEATVTVVSGEAVVEAAGKSVTVKEQERTKVDAETGVAAAKAVPVRLKSPVQNKVRFDQGSHRLEWTAQDQAGDFVVEVSTDNNFRRILRRDKVRGTNYQLRSLPAGEYYWRVGAAGESEAKEYSVVGRIKVDQWEAPKLLQPPAGALFKVLPQDKQRREMRFSWAANPTDEGRYDLQVTPPIAGQSEWRLANKSLLLAMPSSGQYQWRVRYQSSDGYESPWSEQRQFQIEEQPEPKPPRWEQRGPLYHFAEATTPAISLSWSTDGAARNYRLKVTRDRPDGDVVVSQSTPQPQIVFSPPATGLYYATVEAQSFTNVTTQPTPALAIQVGVKPTLITKPPRDGPVSLGEEEPLSLSWSPRWGAEQYRVQIARDQSFSDILADEQVDSPAWQWSPAENVRGAYVRVIPIVAGVGLKPSAVRYVQPRRPPALPAPSVAPRQEFRPK